MKRWLILLFGLAIASGAAYALLGGGGPVAPPLDDIDDASRARLDRVLREAERSP